MFGIQLNTKVIKTAVRVIRDLITTQSTARTRLLSDLTNVCTKCDDAYGALITRLRPIHAARTPARVAVEIQSFTSDATTRKKFKPERLCSEIDKLLVDLASNVKSLKYAVNVGSITTIQQTLRSMGNYDQALYHQYDEFRMELQSIGQAIQAADASQQPALVAHAKSTIADTERDLREAIRSIRKAKDEIVKFT